MQSRSISHGSQRQSSLHHQEKGKPSHKQTKISGFFEYFPLDFDVKSSSSVRLIIDLYQFLQKFSILGGWEGYRWIESERSKKPSFGVKKLYRSGSRKRNQSVCEINVGFERFSLVKMDGKLAFRIININGEVVAEVIESESESESDCVWEYI